MGRGEAGTGRVRTQESVGGRMLPLREGDVSDAMLLFRDGEGTCSEMLHLRAVLGI